MLPDLQVLIIISKIYLLPSITLLSPHKPLILNWFRAKGTLSSGPVEGLNNKAKLAIRKAYGFRTLDALQIALYHQLGSLKEPPATQVVLQ